MKTSVYSLGISLHQYPTGWSLYLNIIKPICFFSWFGSPQHPWEYWWSISFYKWTYKYYGHRIS